MEPRAYDLEKSADVGRLMRELKGYMGISLGHGSDTAGRRFAFEALCAIVDRGYYVSIDTEPFEPPTVGNEVL